MTQTGNYTRVYDAGPEGYLIRISNEYLGDVEDQGFYFFFAPTELQQLIQELQQILETKETE